MTSLHRLEIISKGRKKLSGHACVTFHNFEDHNKLLKLDEPQYWKLQRCNYFRFCRPIFASVTLRCHQATHPTSINWDILHTTSYSIIFRESFYWLILLVFMAILINPIIMSGTTSVGVKELKTDWHKLAKALPAPVKEVLQRLHAVSAARFINTSSSH